MSKKLSSALNVFAKYMDVSHIDPKVAEAEKEHEKLELEAIEYSMDIDGTSHWKHKLRIVNCKKCGKKFQTNHCAVSYCSVPCLKESLNEKGYPFNNVKSDYEPPLVVSGKTTERLEIWAKAFLRALEESRIEDSLNAHYTSDESQEEHPIFLQDKPLEESSQTLSVLSSPLDSLIEEDSFFDTL